MADMTSPGAHAKPAARHDHLWVLAVIAACALTEVFASWVFIGSLSGFPRIGGAHGVPTDWTLAVTSEAYWAYALYAWLAASPGPRSRAFAMWSAAAVFVLSLIGQGASHLVPQGAKPSPVLVVFVTSLPVVVLALIAVLIHLRHTDREEAATVAEQDSLRAELDAERAARQAAESELQPVREQLAEVTAKAEALARKLESATGRKQGAATGRKRGAATGRKQEPATGSATAPADAPDEAPADLDSEAKVLWYLDKGYSASRAGVLAGLTDSRGRQLARLAKGAKREPAGDHRSDGDMATGEMPKVSEGS
jgi:hypothetical protein